MTPKELIKKLVNEAGASFNDVDKAYDIIKQLIEMRHFYIIATVNDLQFEMILTCAERPLMNQAAKAILAHPDLHDCRVIINSITEINPTDCRDMKYKGVKSMMI